MEEIDISTFDPTVLGELFTKVRRHTDNRQVALGGASTT